ncbi:MAG: Peptidase M48, Ste24p precursor, partial [uncultured Phycisphaerae bacterium]
MNKFYNNVKTAVFLAALSGLILACGGLIGGSTGLVIALVIAGVMNFGSYFFSDKIALMATGAREVGPDHELYRITAQLAQRAGLPMPRVYVSPDPSPNAFATGRGPGHAAVCATEGLLRVLNRNEVAGVMAHELAHVKHRDILIQSVAVTIGSAITVLAYLGMYLPIGGGDDEGDAPNPLAGLLILILGPIAASLIQMAISRSREYNADTAGAEICGDPMYLASALEKIHAYGRQIPMNVNPAFNSMMIAEP